MFQRGPPESPTHESVPPIRFSTPVRQSYKEFSVFSMTNIFSGVEKCPLIDFYNFKVIGTLNF